MTVTINASGYGLVGGVTETLPPGFTYVSTTHDPDFVSTSGQQVRITLQGPVPPFTYTVTASDTPDTYPFSGTLRDGDLRDHTVGGDTDVTVEAAVTTPPDPDPEPVDPPTPMRSPSATRSFGSATVAAGGQLVVTIDASDYGAAGGVTESLPPGFAYVSTTIEDEDEAVQITGQVATGQTARFTLSGENSFTYTVTASSTAGSHSFSGVLRDDDRNDHTVGGATDVTVEAVAGPRASRSFSPSPVSAGGQVVVTITAVDYGQAGGVTETLPAGFRYVSSSLEDAAVLVTGQTARFTLSRGDILQVHRSSSHHDGYLSLLRRLERR